MALYKNGEHIEYVPDKVPANKFEGTEQLYLSCMASTNCPACSEADRDTARRLAAHYKKLMAEMARSN